MIISENLEKEIKAVISRPNHFTITDSNVFSIYKKYFGSNTFVIKAGENSKTLETVGQICEFLRLSNANRSSTVVAVGGGVVGDIAGFCASIYMRGIDWINVPTTLLALTDSGIGGKTGVDLNNYKNMIGAFHFPKEIYCSSHFVKTLPAREYICGIGEILKTACLNKNIYSFYKENDKKIYKKDKKVIFSLIKMCAEHKDYVVTNDPLEKSILRKSLNYGHTLGHALEAVDRHKLSHGEYILNGMMLESKIFKSDIDEDFYNSLQAMINDALGGKIMKFDPTKIAVASKSDKKNSDDLISFVVVTKEGEYIERKMTQEKLVSLLTE